VHRIANAQHRLDDCPRRFHDIFAYKHSSGVPLIIAQTSSPAAYLYDMDKVVAGDPNPVIGKAMKFRNVTCTRAHPAPPTMSVTPRSRMATATSAKMMAVGLRKLLPSPA